MNQKESILSKILLLFLILFSVACSKEDIKEESSISEKVEKELEKIEISTLPTKTIYALDEQLDIDGLVITGFYTDKTSSKIDIKPEYIEGFNSSESSKELELKVNINNINTSFKITVLPIKIQEKTLIEFTDKEYDELRLPNNIEIIGKEVFAGKKIKKIVLNEGLISIENRAFKESSISEIVFPKSLKSLGVATFFKCTDLEKIDLSHTSVSIIPNNCFTYSPLEEVLLPESLIEIEYQGFLGTKQLKNITIKDGLKSIGNEAFRESGLESITLPNTISLLEQRAFYNAERLKTVLTIGDNYSKDDNNDKAIMENSCFEGCNALKQFSIPKSIKIIGENILGNAPELSDLIIHSNINKIKFSAFQNSSLKRITVENTIPPTAELFYSAWYGFPKGLESIVVPKGTAELYKASNGWSKFNSIITE